jgi:hypothetical protein
MNCKMQSQKSNENERERSVLWEFRIENVLTRCNCGPLNKWRHVRFTNHMCEVKPVPVLSRTLLASLFVLHFFMFFSSEILVKFFLLKLHRDSLTRNKLKGLLFHFKFWVSKLSNSEHDSRCNWSKLFACLDNLMRNFLAIFWLKCRSSRELKLGRSKVWDYLLKLEMSWRERILKLENNRKDFWWNTQNCINHESVVCINLPTNLTFSDDS